MSSNNRRLIWNTRERLLSTDLNDSTALLNAKGTDEIAAALTGDLFKTSLPLSGVISGGIVSANALDNTITVSPILALKNGTPATGLDSPYLKIESLAPIDIDLTAFVDGGSPRWVAIEVSPGDTAEVVSARDIFQPALGTFIPQNVDKIRRPEPVFTVNAGVAAAPPILPLGNPDVIPLAYVYLRAASPAVLTTDVVSCRARIDTETLSPQFADSKGGLNVINALTNTVQLRGYVRKFLTAPVAIVTDGVSLPADLLASTQWVSGEAFPVGGNTPIFAYLMRPPFPAGYDSDVEDNREWLDLSGRIPSSNALFAINGIILWSLSQNAPTLPLAPHPAGGSVANNDPTWNGGTVSAANQTSYIGSVSVQTNGGNGIAQQDTEGDRVRILEDAKRPYDFNTEAASATFGAAGVFANRSPLLLGNAGQGLGTVLRDAYEWDVYTQDNNTGGGEAYLWLLEASGELSIPGSVSGMPRYEELNSPGDVYRRTQQNQLRTTFGTGAFSWTQNSVGAGTTRMEVVTLGYQDPVLASR